ncbi:MAG: Methionyl-tRNA synthetase, beta subunit [Parcubacteria group bacterium GW2011_GWD2_38_12]|nr:MAG: Methionyl-tRNA synthetase, beta subunit [Parcubacteria group bacterium GW2011_GWC2_36_17]KKQ42379.1 MAG: Methionyl-tRNA synthetase, beta subunit [Parcubacteria group bacterium GW2011_GWE2_37_8]KKQ52897.1 MAG: Methionyl-tRNA synthetase, beta subunit [Parcubacteria group bacterium GW2011_GWD2_38_12]KKQ59100.1 MAG: Methionyl-tRNA synthetase, beta subunit [Parcubacteria group bacterium GW2011_GWC1_38_17]KKQ59715.1 MAG: Methionyl-tRNA synthetase, beta subunit [Parcubacteria group bacterium G
MTINFEEFKKVELRVAKVITAEKVEGSEKLLKLRVNLGEDERQIIAGIGRAYNPEGLIGKEVIIVANLEPRKLMGLESQGMVLAASDEIGLALLSPDREIRSGSLVG